MLSRREFLGWAAMLSAQLGAPAWAAQGPTPSSTAARFMGTRADAHGNYFATAFDLAGQVHFDTPLPGRGHGIAFDAVRQHAALCARRPGDFLLIADLAQAKLIHHIPAAPGRFFNGHAAYLGEHLYASETVEIDQHTPPLTSGDGVIGVYAIDDGYHRIGEFPSYGLDPHDLRAIDDRTLVVANGGLLTHPDAPRVNLNVDTMAPTLAYIDIPSGALRRQLALAPELHQLSIRHLAVAAEGTVAVAMQYEGPSTERPPLIALHAQKADALQLVQLPDEVLRGMRNYCGSAAVDQSGRIVAISSPRGGQTVFIDVARAECITALPLADGCGVAGTPEAGEFLVSSGLGGVLRTQPAPDTPPATVALPGPVFSHSHWDNHLTALS